MSENSTITRQTREVTLFQGDDLVAINEAWTDFQRALVNAGLPRAGDDPSTMPEAVAHDDLVREAKERAVVVTVRALGRRTFRKLLADCPPRKDNEGDAAAGCNTEKMAEALLEYVSDHERTIVSPNLGAKSAVIAWLDELSDGSYSLLFTAAMDANQGGQPDPKDSLTSRLAAISKSTSQ